MAFARRKNKWLKAVLAIILCVVVLGGITSSTYYLFQRQLKTIEADYQGQINVLNNTINSYKKIVLIPNEKVSPGEILTADMFQEKEIISSILQTNYMTKEDFGTYALINMEANVPVLKAMITENTISNDVREEEFNMFLLPSNIGVNDYVDIRINFANGEDYIVLSKKKVQNVDITTNTMWLWLDEKEILTISSAIIDAYLHQGTKLYSVTYVEPSIQEASIETYPVNNDVLLILQDNPNILEEAKESMTTEAREFLEERLAYLTEEELSEIDSGVDEENAQRDVKIDEDEAREAEEEMLNEVLEESSTNNETVSENQAAQETQVEEGTNDDGFFN